MSTPATRSTSIASSLWSLVLTRTRPRPTRRKPTPSSAVAPAAPRRAERGEASRTSVATRHAPPKHSSRISTRFALCLNAMVPAAKAQSTIAATMPPVSTRHTAVGVTHGSG